MDSGALIRLRLELAHAISALRRAALLRPGGELETTIQQLLEISSQALDSIQPEPS